MSPPQRAMAGEPIVRGADAAPATHAYDARTVARSRWALLGGNFAIACGVMAPSGVMNDLVDSLQVTAAVAGQLITVGAIVLALGAPLLAAWVAGSDRRRLLTLWLLWYAVGHAIAALSPNFTTLAIVRTVTLLGAAVFTPQAGAAIAVMTPSQARGHAITFVFLGWAVASVLGLPLHAYVAETFGWRVAVGGVAVLSALAAWWIWRVMPDGVRPAALSGAAWRSVFTDPVLMAVVLVTALAGAAQFTLFTYMAAYFRQVLAATPAQIAALFLVFGAVGLASSVVVTRVIDRLGASRMVALLLAGMALSFALWPF
ncbi:MAG TPA: MFS transporter, partial [Burkholderiaceae bacterium]|nr:MFS transporter [Burkholderiaceae bacterium]